MASARAWLRVSIKTIAIGGASGALLVACGSAAPPAAATPAPGGPRVVDEEWHLAEFEGEQLERCADFAIRYTIPAGSTWEPPPRPELTPSPGHRTLAIEAPCVVQFRDAPFGHCQATREAPLTRFGAPSGTTVRMSAVEIRYGTADGEAEASCLRDGGHWSLGGPTVNGSTP